MTIQRIDPGQRFSQAVVAGTSSSSPGTPAASPTRACTSRRATSSPRSTPISRPRETDRSKLLSVSIWLPDIATFGEMNRAWDEWVDRENLPARATVEARLASPDYRVEIAGIARR